MAQIARLAIEPAVDVEHLPAGQVGVEHQVLEGHADPPPHLVGRAHDIVPRDAGAAGGRLHQGGQYIDRRGFASAIGAEQRVDAAVRHAEVDAVECPHLAVALD